MVAASAYRSGSKIQDERSGKVHDYSRRRMGVVQSVILRPEGSPEWTGNPAKLWNTVELGEKRVDAQLAREFVLAVPPELSAKEQFQLSVAWAQKELVASGMVADLVGDREGCRWEHGFPTWAWVRRSFSITRASLTSSERSSRRSSAPRTSTTGASTSCSHCGRSASTQVRACLAGIAGSPPARRCFRPFLSASPDTASRTAATHGAASVCGHNSGACSSSHSRGG